MTRAHLVAQKQTVWQREPSEQRKRELPSFSFKAVYQLNGGIAQWNASVTCKTCKKGWKIAVEKRFGKVSVFSVLTVDRMYTTWTLTSVHQHRSFPLVFFFLFQFVHGQTQPDFPARTSGSNRPGVNRVFRNKCSQTVILYSYMVAEPVH